jgi:hypothetical protein
MLKPTPIPTSEDEPETTDPNTERMWTWFIEYVVIAVAFNRAILHLSHIWPEGLGSTPLNEWTVVAHTATAAITAFTQLLVTLLGDAADEETTRNHTSATFLAAYTTCASSMLCFMGNTQARWVRTLIPAALASADTSDQLLAAAIHLATTIVTLYVTLAASFSVRNHAHDQGSFVIRMLLLVPPCTHWLVQTHSISGSATVALCAVPLGNYTVDLETIADTAAAYKTQASAVCAITPILLGLLELLRHNVVKDLPKEFRKSPAVEATAEALDTLGAKVIINIVESAYVFTTFILITNTVADKRVTGALNPWATAIHSAWLLGIIAAIGINGYEIAEAFAPPDSTRTRKKRANKGE